MPLRPNNAITDVAGVGVGHATVIHDHSSVARTGITVIVPRDGVIGHDYTFAGFHRFNGCGDDDRVCMAHRACPSPWMSCAW